MLTYKEYKKLHIQYKKCKCIVIGCNKPAYYEMGDSRYYCPGCEKHAGLKEAYTLYKKYGDEFLYWGMRPEKEQEEIKNHDYEKLIFVRDYININNGDK